MNRTSPNLEKQIVVLNQASNYLTVGICNELVNRFDHVVLITGSVHEQGEELDERVGLELERLIDDEEIGRSRKIKIRKERIIRFYICTK